MPDQDPFKKYGGKEIAKQDDPFAKYGGTSIEEQPPIKKKEYSGLFGGVQKAVDLSLEATPSQSKAPLKSEKSSGVLGAELGGKPTTSENFKVDENNPFGAITDEVSYTPDMLDSQELKEYNQFSNKVSTKPDTKLVKDIVKSREDSQVMKQRAANYIKDDVMNDPNIQLYTNPDNSIDFPSYFRTREKELTSQMDKLDEMLSMTDIPQKQAELTNEINNLGAKLTETKRYAKQANTDYAIQQANPNSPDFEKQIGINLSKIDDYKGASIKEDNIAQGKDAVRSKDITQKEDFDYKLAGINALKNKTIELYNQGQISKEDAEAKMLDLQKKDANLEKEYPRAKINNIRNWIGEYIANKRGKTKTDAGEALQNIFYEEPSKEEVQDALKQLKGVDLSAEEIQELIRDKDKIPATSMLGHAYQASIGKMASSFNRFTMDENEAEKVNYERSLGFQDPSRYQAEQPFELPEVQKVTDDTKAVRNAYNPNAGDKAGFWSWHTANSAADVAGTIASYYMGNRVGAGLGMENVGANIATSAFLNYHDNLDAAKRITDNKAEQNFIATTKSIITGLIFSGITPAKVAKGAEQTGMKELSEIFKNGKIEPTAWQNKLADVVVRTARDAGKNISLMDADKIASYTIDAIANKESVRGRDLTKEMMDELPSQLASLGMFSLLHGVGAVKADAKEKKKAIETLRMASENIPAFEEGMNKRVDEGAITREQADKEVNFVKSVSEKLKSKDLNTKRMLDVSPEKRLQYAVNLGREQEIKDGIKDMTDDLQIAHEKDKIAELQNERQQTLIEDISDEELYKELKVQSGTVEDILGLSGEDADALSIIHNADLTPTEKQILWRQYKKGVMNLNDVKNYSGIIDLEKLNSEDIGKWARAALEKQKSKGGKFNAEDIDFEELPTEQSLKEQPKAQTPTQESSTRVEEGSGGVGGDVDLGIQQGYAKKAMTDFINSPDMGYVISTEGNNTTLSISEAQVRNANGLKGGDRIQPHEHTNIELTKDEKKQLNKIESDKELGDIDGLEYAKQKRALAKKIFERASNELQQKANEQSLKEQPIGAKPEPKESISELETKRDNDIKEATKVEVDLAELSEAEIDKLSSKQLERVDRVKRDFDRLQQLINCIWGKIM